MTRPPPLEYATPALRRPSFGYVQELGLVIVVLFLGAILSIFGQGFLSWDNLLNGVATNMSIFAIMAVGVTIVIIAGGIDISVGSIYGLSAILTAWAIRVPRGDADQYGALGVLPLAIGLPMLIGLGCGLLNGALVVLLRLHPFIVTLGTMSVFRGLANVVAPAKTLPGQGMVIPGAFTERFMALDYGGDLRLSPMLVMMLCGLAGWVYLHLMVAGRVTYAIGGNEEAARFSGLSVGWGKLRAYALSGLAAGIAGMVSLGRFQSASTNTGMGSELVVIAAAVVGGASLSGGRGSAAGALLGALVIQLIENGIFVLGLDQEYRSIIIGSAIIVAVAIDRLSEYLRQRRLVSARAP